jgi:hypothetical protein
VDVSVGYLWIRRRDSASDDGLTAASHSSHVSPDTCNTSTLSTKQRVGLVVESSLFLVVGMEITFSGLTMRQLTVGSLLRLLLPTLP